MTDYLKLILRATVISLDDFILPEKDAYVPALNIQSAREKIFSADRPLIVEGVCLLAAAECIDCKLSQFVYVKRMRPGNTWRNKIVDELPNDVEEFIAAEEEELRTFAQIENEIEGGDTLDLKAVKLSGLAMELIRYHARFRPVENADYILSW